MSKYTRPNKAIYYLNTAKAISDRSTCMRRHVGAVIVKDDAIVSTGYNGSARGLKNCIDIGECYRIAHNIPSGSSYEFCRAVHGEINAIINASRSEMLNGTMYLYQFDMVKGFVDPNPGVCQNCKRAIINAGIKEIVFADPDGIGATYDQFGYRITQVKDWIDNEDSDSLIVH